MSSFLITDSSNGKLIKFKKLLLKSLMLFLNFYTIVLPSIRQCMYSIACGCFSKDVSFLFPLYIIIKYLKKLCNTIIKFKGMLVCYRCFIAPCIHFNGIDIVCAMAYRLSLCMHTVRIQYM